MYDEPRLTMEVCSCSVECVDNNNCCPDYDIVCYPEDVTPAYNPGDQCESCLDSLGCVLDCNGTCGGPAVEDVCGTCDGGETDVDNCQMSIHYDKRT